MCLVSCPGSLALLCAWQDKPCYVLGKLSKGREGVLYCCLLLTAARAQVQILYGFIFMFFIWWEKLKD